MIVNPSDLKIQTTSEKNNVGEFTFEPLPTGFGNTLGNALRRVLLTSIKGAAATQLKLSGADHQFTTIPGVKEDVVELTLNLKSIKFKSHSENPVVVTINKTGPGEVTAGDIQCPSDVEVVNKDLYLATLADSKAKLEAELVVEAGYGYSPSEERETSRVGVILLDALFSPILSANYAVESTRFGSVTNLDKLVLTVETDGSVSPSNSVLEASELLRTYFERIDQWEDGVVEEEEVEESEEEEASANEDIMVDELPLPTRTINALKKSGIETLKQLANKNPEDLADIKNLGEKSVDEIEKLLKKEGLR